MHKGKTNLNLPAHVLLDVLSDQLLGYRDTLEQKKKKLYSRAVRGWRVKEPGAAEIAWPLNWYNM